MNGEIAALYQNEKQVGGVYNWEISLASDSTTKDGWLEYKVVKNITANSYWLTLAPDSNMFEVKFYKAIQGQLVLMDDGTVEITLPDTVTLDHKLDAPLEMIWQTQKL